jgi:hypothetical protein
MTEDQLVYMCVLHMEFGSIDDIIRKNQWIHPRINTVHFSEKEVQSRLAYCLMAYEEKSYPAAGVTWGEAALYWLYVLYELENKGDNPGDG